MNTGTWNKLEIVKISPKACFLSEGKGKDIYLPPDEVPPSAVKGSFIDVFVYNSAKDELRATTKKPYAVLGEFAALEVVGKTDFGAFLDWGIGKDLFVPRRSMRKDLETGDMAVVRIVHDFEGTGVIGTCILDEYFETDTSSLKPNQQVEMIVFGFSKLGARVIIDNKYSGVLYRNEIFEKLYIGDSRTGFIKKIREDGLVDAALQPQGFKAASDDARTIILESLKTAGGFLPLHDKSSADDIKQALCISKKIFKKTIGGLYKERLIEISDKGITLIKQ